MPVRMDRIERGGDIACRRNQERVIRFREVLLALRWAIEVMDRLAARDLGHQETRDLA